MNKPDLLRRQRELMESVAFFEPRIRQMSTHVQQVVRTNAIKNADDAALTLLCTGFTLIILTLASVNAELAAGKNEGLAPITPPPAPSAGGLFTN